MKTIILSFFLIFREYFLSKQCGISVKVIGVIDFSGCIVLCGCWWPLRRKFRISKQFGRTKIRQLSIRVSRIGKWTILQPNQWRPQSQKFVHAEIGTEYFNITDRVYFISHYEPRIFRVLLHTVLPFHLLKRIQIRSHGPIFGDSNAFPRIWIRIDFFGYKIDECFHSIRRLKTEGCFGSLKSLFKTTNSKLIRIFCGILKYLKFKQSDNIKKSIHEWRHFFHLLLCS